MKNIIAAVIIAASAMLLSVSFSYRIAAGRHTETCWPFCGEMGPKPERPLPCPPFCLSQAERATLNERNNAIIDADLARNHAPLPVGGITL